MLQNGAPATAISAAVLGTQPPQFTETVNRHA
jgi:hypothetical protein